MADGLRAGVTGAGITRAGIIGAGFIGAVHANAVRASGGVVSRAAASTAERSVPAARRLGALASSNSAEALIDDENVDVVHICTPNALHVSLARRALAAGKPVICEKPLATDLDGAVTLAEQAGRPDVLAAVPFVYRFYPSIREVRARVTAGEAGALHLVHRHYLQDWQASGAGAGWRADAEQGGAHRAFADIGVHWCDLVEFTTGHRIAWLVARTHSAGAETSVLFDTDLGASGAVVISQIALGRKNQLAIRLEGAAAGYAFDQEQPETLQIGGSTENRTVHRGANGSVDAARYSVLPPGHPQGYQDCFNAFVADSYAAIRGAALDGLPTFDDGARAAALVHAVVESGGSSSWVDVPMTPRHQVVRSQS